MNGKDKLKSVHSIWNLKGENMDWQASMVSLTRSQTDVPLMVHSGADGLNVFKNRRSESISCSARRPGGL